MRNTKFHKVRNNFQVKLYKDLRKVCSSKKTLTFNDKTSNMYQLEKEEYWHLLQNAVRRTYKKSNKETDRTINCEGIKYAKEANILDKVEVNGTANCFITLKDHKVNSLNHPTTRFINPAKNEIRRISKQILYQINSKLSEIEGKWMKEQWIEALELAKQHVTIKSKDRETTFHARKSFVQ